MTVKELIEELNKHFDDIEININLGGNIKKLHSIELHGNALYLYDEVTAFLEN